MKVVLFGYEGKVGAIMAAGLEKAGHEVLGVDLGDELPDGGEAAVDFTRPDAAVGNIARALELGLPMVVGTTGWESDRDRVDALAKERGRGRSPSRSCPRPSASRVRARARCSRRPHPAV